MYIIKDNHKSKTPKFIISGEYMFGDADEYRTLTEEYSPEEFTEEVQKAWHAVEKLYDEEFIDDYDFRISDESLKDALEKNIITPEEVVYINQIATMNGGDFEDVDLFTPFSAYWGEATRCLLFEINYRDETNALHEVTWVD